MKRKLRKREGRWLVERRELERRIREQESRDGGGRERDWRSEAEG